MKRLTLLLSPLLAVMLSGCATTPPEKAYLGEIRPAEQLAVFSTLNSGPKMSLHSIDGTIYTQKFNGQRANLFSFIVQVLPGRHTFEISFWGTGDKSGVKTVTFTSEAGKQYELDTDKMQVIRIDGENKTAVDTKAADIAYYKEPETPSAAVLMKGTTVLKSLILYRIDGKAGHGARNGNARFNDGMDDGPFSVKLTPGKHTIDFAATAGGWANAGDNQRMEINVEAGKTYTFDITADANGGPVVKLVEKK